MMNESIDRGLRIWLYRHYGDGLLGTYTLFEVTLAGCWPNYLRPLIQHVSGYYAFFTFVYISMVVFAVIRIITAIFLKETLQVASNDQEEMIHEQMKKKQSYLHKLESIFKAVDTSGDGQLELDELEAILSHPTIRTWLSVLELEVHDAKALFRLLDNGDGAVTYGEFLKGVMRLKGQARSIDVVAIMHSTDQTLQTVKVLQNQMNEIQSVVLPKKVGGNWRQVSW